MLADALVEASSETPDILIDCATLTGAFVSKERWCVFQEVGYHACRTLCSVLIVGETPHNQVGRLTKVVGPFGCCPRGGASGARDRSARDLLQRR